MSARDTALSALIACRRQQAWSDGALKQLILRDGLDRRDAALATRLCYGVLQNRLLLDHWIAAFARGGLPSLQPVVLDILRLAVYQIRLSDKIPASAAVNEAVNQTKRLANPRAAGLVNGLLRNMLRSPDRLTLPEDLSLRYSHPQPLVELLRQAVGEQKLEPLLASHNETPPAFLQVNLLVSDPEQTLASLHADGLQAEPHPWLPGCLTLRGGSLEHTRAYLEGAVYAQDPAARLAVTAAGLFPGMSVLDCCSAPGGKSFSAAVDLRGEGEILSCDIHPHKIELIRKGAQRMQLSCIHPMVQDASVCRENWIGRFDTVIADVPCSGLGVIRKKPDVRYKDLAAISALPLLQRRILGVQADYVRPGGVLLYSTCTVLPRENREVVAQFLAEHPGYHPEPFSLPGGLDAPEGMLTLLPCDQGTDGFFIAKLRRES